MIDGGPKTIYKNVLKPRLDELRGKGTLDLRMVMVSHIDLDHITGILDMFKNLFELQNSDKAQPYAVRSLCERAYGPFNAIAGPFSCSSFEIERV